MTLKNLLSFLYPSHQQRQSCEAGLLLAKRLKELLENTERVSVVTPHQNDAAYASNTEHNLSQEKQGTQALCIDRNLQS